MNKHLIIFDKPLNLGGGRHRVRLSIPQKRHTFRTATWLAPFEREELIRLRPEEESLNIIRQSVELSQYAYQIHVDGDPCGICGVTCPDANGHALIWYLPTHLVAIHYRRVILPLSRALIRLFANLQPEARRYANALTPHCRQSLSYVRRLADATQPSPDGSLVFFSINVNQGV